MKITTHNLTGKVTLYPIGTAPTYRPWATIRDVTPAMQSVIDAGGPLKWVPDDPENPKGDGSLAGPTLDDLKASTIKQLESARWAAEVAGITLPDGKLVRTDKETQAELGKALSIIATVDPALEIDWKFPSGEVVHMTPAEIQQIAGAVFTHVQATRTAFKDKAALVAAAGAKEDLNLIEW